MAVARRLEEVVCRTSFVSIRKMLNRCAALNAKMELLVNLNDFLVVLFEALCTSDSTSMLAARAWLAKSEKLRGQATVGSFTIVLLTKQKTLITD